MRLIKTYISKRREVSEICALPEIGGKMIHKSNKWMESRLLKPSMLDIDEFIKSCRHEKVRLEDFLAKYKKQGFSFSDTLVNNVVGLEIKTLQDCKSLGDEFFRLFVEIKQQRKISVWAAPVFLSMLTPVEIITFAGICLVFYLA